MSIPPRPKLEEATRKIVWGAQKKGNLRDFTARIVRQTVEKEFLLDHGTLDAPEYKEAIKVAMKSALDEKPPAGDESEMEDKDDKNLKITKTKTSPKRKRKSDVLVKSEVVEDVDNEEEKESLPTPKVKGKAKAKKASADDGDDDEDGSAKKKRKTVSRKPKAKVLSDNEDHEGESPKKGKTASRKPKKAVSEDEEVVKPAAKRSRAQKDSKAFKSLEHVPTSDMEQDEPDPINVAGPSSLQSSKPTKSAEKQTPSRRKSTQDNETTPRKPVSAAKPKLKEPIKSEDVEMGDAAVKSESELSVLVDEPPKRKRKSNSGENKPTKPKEKKGKASSTLSKDEETVKRLKSLVVACGTRKVWSKVFQNLDTPQQQIKKLKEILTDLGMTGRMSMEQAKAIKEKRELAQELQDVVEFASKVTGQTSRSQKESSDGRPSKGDDESEKGQESALEDEENAAPKRSTTARKSIMAFLEDQSDDE